MMGDDELGAIEYFVTGAVAWCSICAGQSSWTPCQASGDAGFDNAGALANSHLDFDDPLCLIYWLPARMRRRVPDPRV